MQAGKAYMNHDEGGIVHRNICTEDELEVPKSTWEIPTRVKYFKNAD